MLPLLLFFSMMTSLAQEKTPSASSGRKALGGPVLQQHQQDVRTVTGSSGVKNAFAIMTLGIDENVRYINNVVQFPLQANPTFRVGFPFYEPSSAGAYANDSYYVATTRVEGNVEVPHQLVRIDLEQQKSEVVGSLNGLDNFINDMTYDYSTSTLFAIARNAENTVSQLYTIDLQTATVRKKAVLDRRCFTLACSYDGKLYAVSYTGDFCSIDKQSGSVKVVGPTGYRPTYFQSMEFDHSTGTLYWAPNIIKSSEAFDVETNMLATIDVRTGKATEIGLLAEDIQLAGLYIPFVAAPAAAPAAVSGFQVVPAPKGVAQAELSWTNPSKTFGGSTLPALQKVEILRDDVVIKTFDAPIPGAAQTYTDVLTGQSAGSNYRYKVVAYNEAGAGAPAEVTAFVGMDVPASPGALSGRRLSSDGMVLSWQAPLQGANGGYVDRAALSYKVVRQPGDNVLAEHLTETVFTDGGIKDIDGYTYQVYAVNAQGESEAAVTPKVVLGPSLKLPYDCDFTPAASRAWTVVDADADGSAWKMEYAASLSAHCATYRTPETAVADDWLVTHVMDIRQGESYKITFDAYSLGPNDFSFYLLSAPDSVASPVQRVGSVSQLKCYMLSPQSLTFTAGQGGTFHLGIHVESQPNTSWLYLTNFHMERLAEHNLAAVSLKGTDSPVKGNTYSYRVTVQNKGSKAEPSFMVRLKDLSGKQLGTTAVTRPLEAGQTVEVPVQWTASDDQTTGLQGEVESDADRISEDNQTAPMMIEVQPEGSPEKVALGMQSDTYAYTVPFTLSSTRSANQNIYAASEIGFEAGWVRQISYRYTSNATQAAVEVPVKVYLANTSRADNRNGWLPESAYTLVYEGVVRLEKGHHQIALNLDRSFYYSGQNLAVLTTHAFDGYGYAMGISFPYYESPLPGNSAIGYGGNDPFDFTQYSSRRQGNASVVMNLLVGKTSLSGCVTDTEHKPIAGALVRLVELGITVMADETGNYQMGYLPEGNYTLECSKDGFLPRQQEQVTVGKEGLKLDFCLQRLAAYTVSGKVLSPDGSALAGARVCLNGYHRRDTVTDVNGQFVFNGVQACEQNEIVVSKDWYQTSSAVFAVTEGNVALKDMTLNYYIYPAVNARLEPSDAGMAVHWEEAFAEAHLQKDNGHVASQYGLTSGTGTGLIGTAFRTPVSLKEVSWFTTREGGPHHTVNLYIYALDENGNPTGDLLYSKRSIANKDGQWTVHTLDHPVMAPFGCAVTLNYPGFLGIAIDDASHEYPFEASSYVYTSDYNLPVFAYLDRLGLKQNLLIRASGNVLPENIGKEEVPVPEKTSGFVRFKVWRMTEGTTSVKDGTDLTAEPLAATDFVDEDWQSLPPAVYRYAICGVYPDGRYAQPVFTPYVAHHMALNVTVKAVTNSKSASAAGAVVTLTGSDDQTYTDTIGTNNQVTFTDLWKGVYRVAVTLPGFEPVEDEQHWTVSDSYTTPVYLLKEVIEAPYNLSASVKEDRVQLYWNEAGDIFDDFEEHPDFEVASAGKAGWTYLDRDQAYTYASKAFNFPHRQEPMSYIVFNPEMTEPAVSGEKRMQPYSGQKFLACFNAVKGNDDYIFSPQLNYHEGGTLTFYAKSYVAQYQDKFQVGYSTGGKAPEDFVWMTAEEPLAEWEKYTYELPAGTQYIAINCISGNNGFILMIDDISISSGKQQEQFAGHHAPEVQYEVRLDGQFVGTTDHTTFSLTGLDKGEHRVGIRAVYHSGKSEESFLTLNAVSGVELPEQSETAVFRDPVTGKIGMRGSCRSAELFDAYGRKLSQLSGGQCFFDVAPLPAGVYIVRWTGADGRSHAVKVLENGGLRK